MLIFEYVIFKKTIYSFGAVDDTEGWIQHWSKPHCEIEIQALKLFLQSWKPTTVHCRATYIYSHLKMGSFLQDRSQNITVMKSNIQLEWKPFGKRDRGKAGHGSKEGQCIHSKLINITRDYSMRSFLFIVCLSGFDVFWMNSAMITAQKVRFSYLFFWCKIRWALNWILFLLIWKSIITNASKLFDSNTRITIKIFSSSLGITFTFENFIVEHTHMAPRQSGSQFQEGHIL